MSPDEGAMKMPSGRELEGKAMALEMTSLAGDLSCELKDWICLKFRPPAPKSRKLLAY